jgi:LPXTG-motif cell wall-anchored protein
MKHYLILTTFLVLGFSIVPQVVPLQNEPSLKPSGAFTAPGAPQLQNNNSTPSSSPTPTPTPTPTPARTQTLPDSSPSSPSVSTSEPSSWTPWIIVGILALMVAFLLGRRRKNT